MNAYLFLPKIVREIGNHDFGLGRDAIFRRSTLTGLAGSLGLGLLAGLILALPTFLRCQRFVCRISERLDLTWNVGWAIGGSLSRFVVLALLATTGTTAATSATSTATTPSATSR